MVLHCKLLWSALDSHTPLGVLIALSLSHSLPLALALNYNVLKSRQCEFESFVILVAMVTTLAFCGACVVLVVLSVSGVEGCAEPC